MKNLFKTRFVSLFKAMFHIAAMQSIAIIALVAVIGISMTACDVDEDWGKPLYIITGSGTSFSATRNGNAVPDATGRIQAVVTAIKKHAKGAAVTVQLGNGTDVLNVGEGGNTWSGYGPVFTNLPEGSGTWGALTVTGKVTSTASNGTIGVNNTSATFRVDINNTRNSISSNAFVKQGTGTVTIASGTITQGSPNTSSMVSSPIYVSGGEVVISQGVIIDKGNASSEFYATSNGKVTDNRQ